MTTDTPPPPDSPAPDLKHAEILQLPCEARLVYVEQIRVFYPRWYQIRAEIKKCHELNRYSAEPQCLMLVGPTGAGKTTLIESYASQFISRETETGWEIPIVKATIPQSATVKTLASTLLEAIGDPLFDYGTADTMTKRAKGLFKDCKVELLILDELQHFVDRESERVLVNVSNWLKTFIKEIKLATVLVGLQGEAEQVVDSNSQLARLFGDPHVLAPFQWNEAQPTTIGEFRRFLTELEKLLPLNETSELDQRETAWRCFVASSGVIGYLMALVRRATYLSLTHKQERLTYATLAEAFDQRLAGQRRGLDNPFIGDPPIASAPATAPASPYTTRSSRRSRARGGSRK